MSKARSGSQKLGLLPQGRKSVELPSAEVLVEALENGFDSVWILSLPSFELQYANKRNTEQLLGYGIENFFGNGQFWLSLVLEEDRPIAVAANEAALQRGYADVVYRMVRQDGEVIWVDARLKLVKDQQGNPVRIIGTTTDVTERIEAQRRLMQSSKMSSLGEMAGGMAHEINNPLAIITGRSNVLREMAESGSVDLKKFIDGLLKIESTAARIAKIINGLRTFSRSSEEDLMEEVMISQVLEETLSFCQEKFVHHSIDLQVKLAKDILVECRPSQLAQVLLNLLSNAQYAVSSLEVKWVTIDAFEVGDAVKINVTDSGGGIPDRTSSMMMQPFFTTKEIGKGTGLGLSIARGIVESHHGELDYDHLSRNTRFSITLPRRQPKAMKKAG